jgi:hypothetical protein
MTESEKMETLLSNIQTVKNWINEAEVKQDKYSVTHYKAVLMGLNLALNIFKD